MNDDKKKFRDTKLGQFLAVKAPKILDSIGDVLPDKGVLGIVKNLIGISEDLTPEEKQQAYTHMQEIFDIEVRDRESARLREVEIVKAGKVDIMFNLTGAIGLLSFAFIIYAIVFLTIPEANKEVWINLIGIVEGIVISIFGYFFGSSVRKNIQ